ncbi:hypothetical protein Q7P35_003443 [Cladosporium inversicolor]
MEDEVCKNTGTYAVYFPICCTTNVSAEFKDRFLQADQDRWGNDIVGAAIFVDSVDTLYTEGQLIGHNTSTSPESAFIGQKAKGCHTLLKCLAEQTGSPVNLRIYAILDERSLTDDTILVIEVCESEGYLGVRMEGVLAISRMFQYQVGDIGIDEDMEEAAETADGVFRLDSGGCEGCKWCSGEGGCSARL